MIEDAVLDARKPSSRAGDGQLVEEEGVRTRKGGLNHLTTVADRRGKWATTAPPDPGKRTPARAQGGREVERPRAETPLLIDNFNKQKKWNSLRVDNCDM